MFSNTDKKTEFESNTAVEFELLHFTASNITFSSRLKLPLILNKIFCKISIP